MHTDAAAASKSQLRLLAVKVYPSVAVMCVWKWLLAMRNPNPI